MPVSFQMSNNFRMKMKIFSIMLRTYISKHSLKVASGSRGQSTELVAIGCVMILTANPDQRMQKGDEECHSNRI